MIILIRRSIIAVLLEQFKNAKPLAKQLQLTGRQENPTEEEEHVSIFVHDYV